MAALNENGHAKIDNGKSRNGSSNSKQVVKKQNGKHQNGNGTSSSLKKAAPTSKPPGLSSKVRKLAECLLGLSLPLWSTFALQANEPTCRNSWFIASTMAIYGIFYALLRHCKGFLQPPLSSWIVDNTKNANNNHAAQAAAAEWRSRFLAIVNALILLVGSWLCFTEWSSKYVPKSEGWVKTLPLTCDGSNENEPCSCFVSHPITFASLFVGYLQWDLCWLIWHRDTHPDTGAIIHHSIFIGVTQFVLSDTYFRKPFAWLSLAELSTPFLHVRWFMAATGQKNNQLYFWVSLGFAITFLTTRSLGYGLGLVDLWFNKESWVVISGLWGVVAGLHLAYLLNLFWSVKVGGALLRAMSGSNTKGTPVKHKSE